MSVDRSTPQAVSRYFEGLDAGDHSFALSVFAENATYSHPGLGDAPQRRTLHGRDAISKYLADRGDKPWVHVVTRIFCEGASCLLEGVVRTEATEIDSFVSSVDLNSDGLILRYVTYASFPAA